MDVVCVLSVIGVVSTVERSALGVVWMLVWVWVCVVSVVVLGWVGELVLDAVVDWSLNVVSVV